MTAIFPLPVWVQGTTQPSTPVNDSFLRTEVLARGAISITSTPPGSPADGETYILGAAPTGAWSTFAENDVVLWRSGTWYRFAPFFGWLKQVGTDVRRYDGTAWVIVTGGGGGGSLRDGVSALSISSGVVNIDCALGDFFTLALTANVTSITFTNLPASGKAVSIALRATQDGTGGRTVALPAEFKATTGSDTAVQSAASAITLVTLTTFDQGTRWEYTMRGVAA
jgi:hypothetical protein